MELSLTLARFWGIVLITICITFIFNKKIFKKILKAEENEQFILLSGFLALLIGALHISIHNVWEANYRGVVTLLGWATLVRGVIRLNNPELPGSIIHKLKGRESLLLTIFAASLILGVYLLYVSFV